jgi:hypothetical protein
MSTYPTAGRPSLAGIPTGTALEAFGADRIFLMVTNGEGYREIAEAIPCGIGALYDWLALPANTERHAIAREAKADILFGQVIAIADDGRSDTYIDEKGNTRTDNEIVQRSRLRVETRLRVASKLNPAKYGERVAVDQTVTLSPLADAFARITAGGSSIPISSAYQAARVLDVVDVIPVELELCVLCGDDGIDGAGCPLCGVIQVPG